jgi:hypothetical protein
VLLYKGENMPPKIIFTKEQIIDSAFEIFKKEGIESISV